MNKSGDISHTSYRPSIDGLRAIAVISVVIFHAFPKSLRGGFVGVDIFFVISGFLITNIILSQLQQGRFSFLDFYGRRIRRIFPALAVVLITCLVIGWFFLMPHEYAQLGKHVFGGAGFISNLILLSEVGYFDNAAETKPLLHLWSLGVEDQFYIFWPLACLFIFSLKLKFDRIVAVLLGSSLVLCVVSVFGYRDFSFYFPLSRFWELGIGAFLAGLFSRQDRAPFQINAQLANWLSVAGLILVIAGFFVITPKRLFPGFWPLIPTAGAMLLIASGENAWINKHILSLRPFVFAGLISYPLYLWHWPLLSFVRIAENTFREAPAVNRLIAVALSFVLAWLTYAVIEKWFRFGSGKRMKIAILTGLMSLAGAAGIIVLYAKGLPSRIQLQPPAAMVLVSEYPHPLKNKNCKTIYPDHYNQWSCLLSKPRPAEVILIGDSHAHQYFRAFGDVLSDRSVLNISSPGCLPFVAAAWHSRRCKNDTSRISKFIRESKSIKTVYLTGYFSVLAAGAFKHGNIEGKRVAAQLTAGANASFQKSASSILQNLLGSGKKVIIIGDIPDMIFRPVSCVRTSSALLNRLRFSGGAKQLGPDSCYIDKKKFEQRNKPYDDALQGILVNFPKVRFFDPRPVICDQLRCWAIRDGVPLYWNSDHLTYVGTIGVVKKLMAAVPP
jgi:peptidoglycan/LPS O-acetylase OafA/YrhL